MNFLGADVFQSIVTFFEGVRDSLSLEGLLFLFIGLEIFAIVAFIIVTHFIYELRLVRAIDRLNVFLYEAQYINENNLIELNNLMKAVPKTLRYHWQEYMLNRDKNPSFYMSVENCIDRPLKTSAFQAIIKIIKAFGFVFAGLAFLFTCGYAAGVGEFGADFFITVFTIPVFILIINYLFVIALNIRMAANTTELYQTFHIFNRFIDKAVSTMPEYVDFEVLFTEKEIKRGIPVLNEYIEKRQIQEQEELKRARENAIQHEQYNFKPAGEKGELVLERAMKETEIFIGVRTRLNTEIQHLESEIESLKRNFENTTKDYQKKLQASKENSLRLREQQEATTNKLEYNYIRKQQSDEIKKQEQIEKDQEDAQLRFNQEINNLSEQIAQRKQEIQEAKVNLEKAMLAEYTTFANKIFKEVKEDVNTRVREERDGLIKSREEVERELEEAVNRIDILENKVVLCVSDSSSVPLETFDDMAAALKEGTILLGMGNSDVPVGQYTQKILEYYGLNEEELAANGRISYGSNVKEVTTQVSEGAVDCGVIYCTDAYSAGLTASDYATPEMCGQVIYPAAVIKNSQHQEEAQAFLDFLQTDPCMEIFEQVGFSRVEEG